MVTSKKVASDAARVLDNPKSSKLQRELAGSDLAQAKRVKERNRAFVAGYQAAKKDCLRLIKQL